MTDGKPMSILDDHLGVVRYDERIGEMIGRGVGDGSRVDLESGRSVMMNTHQSRFSGVSGFRMTSKNSQRIRENSPQALKGMKSATNLHSFKNKIEPKKTKDKLNDILRGPLQDLAYEIEMEKLTNSPKSKASRSKYYPYIEPDPEEIESPLFREYKRKKALSIKVSEPGPDSESIVIGTPIKSPTLDDPSIFTSTGKFNGFIPFMINPNTVLAKIPKMMTITSQDRSKENNRNGQAFLLPNQKLNPLTKPADQVFSQASPSSGYLDHKGMKGLHSKTKKISSPQKSYSIDRKLKSNKSNLTSIRTDVESNQELIIQEFISTYEEQLKKFKDIEKKTKLGLLTGKDQTGTKEFLKKVYGDPKNIHQTKSIDEKHFNAASCSLHRCEMKPDARLDYTVVARHSEERTDYLVFGGIGMKVYNDGNVYNPKAGKTPWTEVELQYGNGKIIPRLHNHTVASFGNSTAVIYGGVQETNPQICDLNPYIYTLDFSRLSSNFSRQSHNE